MVSEQNLTDSGGGGRMADCGLDCSALTATNASRGHVVISCSIQKHYQQGLDSVLHGQQAHFHILFVFDSLTLHLLCLAHHARSCLVQYCTQSGPGVHSDLFPERKVCLFLTVSAVGVP